MSRKIQGDSLQTTLAATSTFTTLPTRDIHTSFEPLANLKQPLPTNLSFRSQRTNKKTASFNRDRRYTRTLGVIIAVCIFCWMPFIILWPIQAYFPEGIPLPLLEYSYWTLYLNSTINPLLYFMSNSDFRRAFSQLISRR